MIIPKSVVEIHNSAFLNCDRLEEVVFVEGSVLKTIGEYAFSGCSMLEKISFPEGLEIIGRFAFAKTRLESIEFPASLGTIGQGAFYHCKRLRTVEFSDGLETLGTEEYQKSGGLLYGVFEESAVENVRLPQTLKNI